MEQMNLGWKTIVGASLIALGQIASAGIADCPVPAWIPWLKWLSGWFTAAGAVFAGVGVSGKIANAVNIIVNSMSSHQEGLTKALEQQKIIEKVVTKRVPYIVKQLGPEEEIVIKKRE